MARVRLRVHEIPQSPHFTCDYLDPVRRGNRRRARHRPFPLLRLVASLRPGSDPDPTIVDPRLPIRAIIDTGAWITIIRRDTWEEFDQLGLLERLRFAHPANPQEPRRSVVGGSASDYSLGRIWFGVFDEDQPSESLSAVPVVAQLLHDRNARLVANYSILLGMHDSIFTGRRLRREPRMGFDPTTAPTTGLPYSRMDAGPRYGQDWWLEDAA